MNFFGPFGSHFGRLSLGLDCRLDSLFGGCDVQNPNPVKFLGLGGGEQAGGSCPQARKQTSKDSDALLRRQVASF